MVKSQCLYAAENGFVIVITVFVVTFCLYFFHVKTCFRFG
jgi:hypothetical protein